MNFPNDNSKQTGVVNVSYTPTYANVNNPNILSNDLKSGSYDLSLHTILSDSVRFNQDYSKVCSSLQQ